MFNRVGIKLYHQKPVIRQSVALSKKSEILPNDQTVRFSEDKSNNPKNEFFKSLIWGSIFLTPLSILLFTKGNSNTNRMFTNASKQIVQNEPILHKQNSPKLPLFTDFSLVKENDFLTEKDKNKYREIEALYQKVESRSDEDNIDQDLLKLKNASDELRARAANWDQSARTISQALSFNRMYDELTQPSANLIRMNYEGFDKLLSQYRNGRWNPFPWIDQPKVPKHKFLCLRDEVIETPPDFELRKLTDAQFKTELQWRAIVGLYSYFSNRDSENELIPTESIRKLYDPVMTLLNTNKHDNIQRHGNRLMVRIFPYLDFQQKHKYLDHVIKTFLDSAPGTEKLASMLALSKLYENDSTLPQWQGLLSMLHLHLKENRFNNSSENLEAKKYDTVLLGLLRDKNLVSSIEPFGYEKENNHTQRAVAWALGRLKTPESFSMLKKIIENTDSDPVAGDMAMYSIAENINDSVSSKAALDIINNFATDSQYPEHLREAAKAIQERLKDRSETESDFYINLLLKTEEEKQAYRENRDRYIAGSAKLSVFQQNLVDRVLLPFRQHIKTIIDKGGRHQIVPGTITNSESYKGYYGFRSSDGRLYDSISGVSSSDGGAVTGSENFRKEDFDTFCHEFFHHFHQMIMDEDDGFPNPNIGKLYQEALQDLRILDYYAKGNEYEFFAQGGEAMGGRRKKHDILFKDLFNNGFDSTDDHLRSWLKRTNPDLFKFIKDLGFFLELSQNSRMKEPLKQMIALNNPLNTENKKTG